MPSLNEICESVLELSHTQVKTCGDMGSMEVKPVYPVLSCGDITSHTRSSPLLYNDCQVSKETQMLRLPSVYFIDKVFHGSHVYLFAPTRIFGAWIF